VENKLTNPDRIVDVHVDSLNKLRIVETARQNNPQSARLSTVKITKANATGNSHYPCICSIIMALGLTGVSGMKDISPIQSSWFYMYDIEKCKFNWFLYEYACTLYDHIKRSKDGILIRWRSKYTNKQLADYCAYFSKRMRQSVFRQLDGHTETIYCDEDYAFDYCHADSAEEILALLEAARLAWDELLEICVVCPERCITEREVPSVFFDMKG